MSLKTLQGTIDAESYISIEEANIILATDTEWLILDSNQKENALKLATQLVDSLYFYGDKLFSSQALEFPRSYFPYILVSVNSIFQGLETTLSDTSGIGDTSITKTLNTIVREGSIEITVNLMVEGISTTVTITDDGGSSANPFEHPIYIQSSSMDYSTGDLNVVFNYSIEDNSSYSIDYRYHPTIQYDSFTSSSVLGTSLEDYPLYASGAALVIYGTAREGIGAKVSKIDRFNGLIITEPFTTTISTSDSFYLIPQLPENLRIAVAKQASFLLNNNRARDVIMRQAGVIQYKIGDVFASYSSDPVTIKNLFQPEAFSYIREYIGKKIINIGRA